jgi:HSP20 family protein
MSDWFDKLLPDRFGREEENGLPAVFDWGMPAMDVVEEDDKVRVTAELPGLEKDDFNVEVVGDRLIIRGEKKTDCEKKEGDYYYSECSYGSFSRSVDLPAEVDVDKAEATYKNGRLSLTLPKTEAAKSKRVKVAVE